MLLCKMLLYLFYSTTAVLSNLIFEPGGTNLCSSQPSNVICQDFTVFNSSISGMTTLTMGPEWNTSIGSTITGYGNTARQMYLDDYAQCGSIAELNKYLAKVTSQLNQSQIVNNRLPICKDSYMSMYVRVPTSIDYAFLYSYYIWNMSSTACALFQRAGSIIYPDYAGLDYDVNNQNYIQCTSNRFGVFSSARRQSQYEADQRELGIILGVEFSVFIFVALLIGMMCYFYRRRKLHNPIQLDTSIN